MQNKREYQKVIDYLYKLIESGQLTVGERLPTERTLAETLSISRNSIREAIRSLENMGIIESRAGSGNYIVNKISGTVSEMLNMMMMLKQIDREEVCSFRRNLDKAVCFTIIESGLSEEYSEKLSEALAAEQNADTLEEQNNCDYDFHYTLIMATQNGLWISIAEAVISIYRRWLLGNSLPPVSDTSNTYRSLGLSPLLSMRAMPLEPLRTYRPIFSFQKSYSAQAVASGRWAWIMTCSA